MKIIIGTTAGILIGFIVTSLMFWEHGQAFSFLTWRINGDNTKPVEDCLVYLKDYVQTKDSASGSQRVIFCLKRPERVIKAE